MYGLDYQGNLCGDKNNGTFGPDFTNRTKLYWLDVGDMLTGDFGAAKGICLHSCPTNACPNALCTRPDQLLCQYNTDYENDWATMTDLITGNDKCSGILFETVSVLNKCFPTVPDYLVDLVNNMPDKINETTADATTLEAFRYRNAMVSLKDAFSRETMQRYIADLYNGWTVLAIAGLAAGVVISLLWIIFLRFFAGVMSWVGVFLVNALFILFTLVCYVKAGHIKLNVLAEKTGANFPDFLDPSENDRDIFRIIAYVLSGVTLLLLLLTIALIPRIRVAVATLKVASQAIGSMPHVVFFPIIPFILTLGLIIYWFCVIALLYSAGDVKYDPAVDVEYDLVWTDKLRWMAVYHLFGLLWTNQFIVGLTQTILAGAIAAFYWGRGDPGAVGVHGGLLRSCWRTLRYHMGSIALGSFIVAIIQFIRIIVEYIDKKSKAAQKENALLKYFMYCLRCCLWCLEQIVKFINRNTYIIIALKGSSYCKSANRAVQLIVGNVLRVATVNIVGDILLFLGKLCVAAGCGLIAFAMCNTDRYTDPTRDTYLSSPLFPVAFSVLAAFLIASIFFQVYEMAVDTILLCFCEDCEQNNGNPLYAPPLLLSAIGQSKESQRRASTVAPAK
eukprot:jgi/Mesvir1/26954/Mv20673-RA.2